MLNDFLSLLTETAPVQSVLSAARSGTVTALYDLCEGLRAAFSCALSKGAGRPVLLIAQNDAAALRLTDDCATLTNGRAAYLPAESISFTRGAASRETTDRRMEALVRVHRGEADVLIATADALQTRLPDLALFEKKTLRLLTGGVIAPSALMKALTESGYERVDIVEGKGQCALRGEIVDVFAPSLPQAVRIEFFDDEIDSIRTFDLMTQRSLDKLTSVSIPPAEPFLYADGQRKPAADALRRYVTAQVRRLPKDLFTPSLPPLPGEEEEGNAETVPRPMRTGLLRLLDDADTLESGGVLPNARLFVGVLTNDEGNLSEWLRDPLVIMDAPENVRARAEDRRAGFEEEFKLAMERQEVIPEQQALVLSFDELLERLRPMPLILMQDFLRDMSGLKPDTIVQMTGKATEHYLSRFKDLVSDVRAMADEGFRVLLLSGGAARGERLQIALSEQGLPLPVGLAGTPLLPGAPVICPSTLSRGFVLPNEKLALISDSDIFGAGYKKARKTRTAGEKIEAFTDLKEGDYVVHEHHGVGIFKGTVRLQTEGTYRDYILIQYRGSDKLYVPTDQFDRVQKYIGGQEKLPPLNSLGGGDWEKQKKKVKAGLKKLAFDLVKLYADRKTTPGHAFAPDTPWQRQFEDYFPFELTPDQQRAVRDITQDMEAPTNMDRLLCGDVGYGKTEVALRAAFKAVMDGKQVALLAPTTILVQQHFYTLQKRLAEFPVNVDVVSRFRSAKAQRETLQRVREGKVDILVGTHRILSKDVVFKDLGLLIVDEEQRFGVQHKEQIKHMKTGVDVLTLSATPIPRTLHMSMVGVRDMSLLETPPEERFPVQTYVIDYQDGVIRDAIRREMARKGQVYFLNNRVRSIDEFAARLRALVPEARIGVGHGQMKEQQLEDIMLDFYDGRYDVLLSTTIIENGLDVPNANTLIVFDADRFGLSQLYQLRGRVGRSNRSAYAYFTVRPDKMLTEDAQKRLSAIREFTEFGSGFRIAMRDLEIRGAGNIFGPEQSGNVSAVGYDMYVKLIEEAVREAQSESGGGEHPAQPVHAETRVDLKVDAYLPAEYVSGDVQRMEVYKRISLIRTREDREDVIEELIDRFGEPPAPVMRLIDIAQLRALLSPLGVSRVTFTAGTLVMRVEPSLLPPTDRLLEAMTRTDKRLLLSAAREPSMLLRDKNLTAESALVAAVPLFERLNKLIFTKEKPNA